AALVIVMKVSEAKFGIEAPGNLATERSVGLHGNDGIKVKAADIHFTGQVKSLVQLISTADSDVGIGPIFGKTVTPIELCLQNRGNSLLRCHGSRRASMMNRSSLNFSSCPRGGNGIGGLFGSSAPCMRRSRTSRRSWFAAATSWAAAWLTLLSAEVSSSLVNEFV